MCSWGKSLSWPKKHSTHSWVQQPNIELFPSKGCLMLESEYWHLHPPPQKKRRRRGKKEKKVWGWGWGDKALPKQNKNLLKCCFEVKPLQWHLAKNLLRWQGSCSSGMWRNANCTVLNPHSYWEFVLTIYSFINILCSARNKIVENVSIWGTTAYFSSCSWIFASTGHSSLLL